MPIDKVLEYYNHCLDDYAYGWNLDTLHAIHYGYHDKEHHTHAKALYNMNRILADTAQVTKNDVVLDAGCGVGGSAIWLAENCGAHVMGVNIHSPQLDKARVFAKKKDISEQVQFEKQDYCNTSFKDRSFTVIWEIEAMCHADDKKQFLKEAYRLLKRGGRIIGANYFLLKLPQSKSEIHSVNEWLNGWAMPHFMLAADWKKQLKNIGFTNIKFIDITPNVLPSSKKIFWLSIKNHLYVKYLQWKHQKTNVQMGSHKAGFYQYLALKKRICVYGLYYAEK